jgi:hypothetical protein
MDIEELEERQLEVFRARYERLAAEARSALQKGMPDTGTPDT